jgi:hypothetical protein
MRKAMADLSTMDARPPSQPSPLDVCDLSPADLLLVSLSAAP